MNDKLTISLMIAGQRFSFPIEAEQEQIYRDAAKMINSRITEYMGRYATVDPNTLLAITALAFTVKLLRANERNDVGPVLREIEAVNKRLDAFVKE